MFNGIVEECATVVQLKKKKNLTVFGIKAKKVLGGTKIGDSVAVNGACLTVTAKRKSVLYFDAMQETMRLTNLKNLKLRKKVNLERALKMSSRLSGHFVTGHIDGIGKVSKTTVAPNALEIHFRTDSKLMKYIVPKGSVCLDGVSLTIGKVKKNSFSVYLIPHTLKTTNFSQLRLSDQVNIETDILAKYILNRR